MAANAGTFEKQLEKLISQPVTVYTGPQYQTYIVGLLNKTGGYWPYRVKVDSDIGQAASIIFAAEDVSDIRGFFIYVGEK